MSMEHDGQTERRKVAWRKHGLLKFKFVIYLICKLTLYKKNSNFRAMSFHKLYLFEISIETRIKSIFKKKKLCLLHLVYKNSIQGRMPF